MRATLLLAACLGAVVQGLKLPDYLRGCSDLDPSFNQCALESARAFFKSSIPLKGDRKYRVPVLDPLSITHLTIDQPGLTLEYSDMTLAGLRNTDIKRVRIDLKTLNATYDLVIPELRVNANYIIKGKILVVPITGQGKINMTWENITATMQHAFEMVPLKDGKQHIAVKDAFFKNELTGVKISMDGLFGGNERLGTHMNQFLNENWKEVTDEMKPAFNSALSRVAEQIYNGLAGLVPLEDLFPKPN